MRMDKSMEITLIYTHMFLYTHSQTCKHVQYRYSNSHIKLYVIQVKGQVAGKISQFLPVTALSLCSHHWFSVMKILSLNGLSL